LREFVILAVGLIGAAVLVKLGMNTFYVKIGVIVIALRLARDLPPIR
jgi:hypothetical protein